MLWSEGYGGRLLKTDLGGWRGLGGMLGVLGGMLEEV